MFNFLKGILKNKETLDVDAIFFKTPPKIFFVQETNSNVANWYVFSFNLSQYDLNIKNPWSNDIKQQFFNLFYFMNLVNIGIFPKEDYNFGDDGVYIKKSWDIISKNVDIEILGDKIKNNLNNDDFTLYGNSFLNDIGFIISKKTEDDALMVLDKLKNLHLLENTILPKNQILKKIKV